MNNGTVIGDNGAHIHCACTETLFESFR